MSRDWMVSSARRRFVLSSHSLPWNQPSTKVRPRRARGALLVGALLVTGTRQASSTAACFRTLGRERETRPAEERGTARRRSMSEPRRIPEGTAAMWLHVKLIQRSSWVASCESSMVVLTVADHHLCMLFVTSDNTARRRVWAVIKLSPGLLSWVSRTRTEDCTGDRQKRRI